MRSRKSLSGAVCICLSAILIRFASADPPATQPATTQPSENLSADSPIRKWFKQLADADPKVRDQARIDLMGISAGDLPKLRQLVIDSQPIAPPQSAAMHDIVVQVFLAGEKYIAQSGEETDASGSVGPYFMGLSWPIPDNEQARLGVAVDVRLPGFPAYRFLRKGDMILGVYIKPDVPLLELPNLETHTQGSVSQAIKASPATRKIALQVLRDGESMKITIEMAPRPRDADALAFGAMPAFNAERVDRAETYWQENFAPLLEAKIDASNLAEEP